MAELSLPGAQQLTQEQVDDLVLKEYMRRKALQAKGRSFLEFVHHIAPWFIIEEIHVLIALQFEKLATQEIDRLMIFLPPRAGKSVLTSLFLPLWWMGLYPRDQVLHTAYAGSLVERFGRNIRNMIMEDAYREVFPHTRLSKDSKAAAQWATTKGGVYNAAGVGAGIAGKGFHIGIIDDPISEQDAFSPAAMENVWNWYGPGFYTRRQPERNVIILTMTRWGTADLAGHLLSAQIIDADADTWEVLSLPAILDQSGADRLNKIATDKEYRKFLKPSALSSGLTYPLHYKEGDSFAKRRWSRKELLRTKAQMTSKVWASLYLQQPYEEEGGIFPRKRWRRWPLHEPPHCEYIIQSYDTAFEEGEENDFSVRTTWGIFRRPEDNRYACIILERMRARVTFPDLRREAWDSYKDYKPDRVLIEKKASGHSLLQEMRRKGVPIKAMEIKGSKLTRAHAASIVLEQGLVYYMPRNWAKEIIDEVSQFPNGEFDDAVDSVVYAWLYLRRTFHLQLLDEEDDDDLFSRPKASPRYKRNLRISQ